MKIRIVGSSIGGGPARHFSMSYIIDDAFAFDAGTLGYVSPVSMQRQIQHVFISHTHIDHIGSLPIFLDNVYGPHDCPTLYGLQSSLDSLQNDIFNDRVWPDLVRLSQTDSPFLKFQPLVSGQAIDIAHCRITPIELNHVVPTLGFVIEDDNTAIALVSDTSPTEDIWNLAGSHPRLKAVFLEASFPESMRWLADKSMHLTPSMMKTEIEKLNRDVPIIAVHVKPAFHEEVVGELNHLRLPNLEVGVPERVYVF